MKISVTGGSGFIGKPLCEALVSLGHDVTLLSRQPGVGGASVIQGDLTVASSALDTFVDECDILFHCAGEVNNPEHMYSLHVDGTVNLLAAVKRRMERSRKPLHWVQLSSTGAYGEQAHKVLVDETFRPAPVGQYEVTKTISDELVSSMAASQGLFTCTIVRPSIVIGPTMPNQSVFQLAEMVRRRLFFYIGNGRENISTYVHVDDVVRALVRSAEDSRAVGKTFIVSNDCAQVEVIDAFAKYAGVTAPRLRVPERVVRALLRLVPSFIRLPLNAQRVDALVIKGGYDSRHIRTALDFEFLRSIPDCIPDFLDGKRATVSKSRKG
ncbi:NAD-dependent epimerase/dehydratase family protein [Pseudomonas sp. CAM1A]|uniref:NAD-dependent epimerase/dehydratase family protein n=1 Tax=Pseudomonas sp. CAM1A TaxID=3231717 RepID=UPI0039C5DDF9